MIRVLSITVMLVPAWALLASQGADDASSGAGNPPQDVRPLLTKYCVSCHGQQKPKAGLNLEAMRAEGNPKAWKLVWDRIKGRQMPPSGKPQPTPAERER